MSQHTSNFDPTLNDGLSLEEIFKAIHSSHSGPARPQYILPWMLWAQEIDANRVQINIYDGDQDVMVFAVDPVTGDVIDSAEYFKDAANLTTGVIPEPRFPSRIGAYCSIVSDWNVADQNGWFMGEDAANAPGPGWYKGSTVAHDNLWATQEVTKFDEDAKSDTKTFRRDKNNGVWNAWYRVYNSIDEIKVIKVNNAGNADTLGGIAPDKFLRTDVANQALRMGSGTSTNFDGILYDDATNKFVFVADGPSDGSNPNASVIEVSQISLRSEADVSGTSTAHAFEVRHANGHRMMMDYNELGYDHGSGFKSVGYSSIVTNARLSGRATLNPSNNNTMHRFGSGRVCTAVLAGSEGNIYSTEHCQLQVYKNGAWVNIGGN